MSLSRSQSAWITYSADLVELDRCTDGVLPAIVMATFLDSKKDFWQGGDLQQPHLSFPLMGVPRGPFGKHRRLYRHAEGGLTTNGGTAEATRVLSACNPLNCSSTYFSRSSRPAD